MAPPTASRFAICSTPDKLGLTAFALEAAEHQLAFYNNYFGIKYPFGKLDIIGVPDFSAGAMENAGAITFRERLLLVDPANSSVTARKRVASIISHEIAHQWFGNLVTMKWWDDIWLNEGFATWMANKPVAAWRPEWQVELDDAADTQGALGIDAMRSTRAIRMKVETPAEINEVFDGIAYEKTAAVLRMIEAYVGPDAFRQGVASYLEAILVRQCRRRGLLERGREGHGETGRPHPAELRRSRRRAGPVGREPDASPARRRRSIVTMGRFIGVPGAPREEQTWTLPACLQTVVGSASMRGDRAPEADGPAEWLRQIRLRRTPVRCSRTPTAVVTTSRSTHPTRFAPWRGRRRRWTPSSDWACSATSGGWSAPDGTTSASTSTWPARSPPTTPSAVVEMHRRTARESSAKTWCPPPTDRPIESWIRARFGQQLSALGLPETCKDNDETQMRRATLLDAGRHHRQRSRRAEAQPRTRGAVPEGSRAHCRRRLRRPCFTVAAMGGDRALYDQYLAQARRTRRAARGSTTDS